MFAERLRELRRSRGLTQLELSERIGLAKSTIAGYEKGFRKPKVQTLNIMAEFFNTSADYIIGLTDNKIAKDPSQDLHKLLSSKDFHYKGTKLSNKDLEFLVTYLERISELNEDQFEKLKDIEINEFDDIKNENLFDNTKTEKNAHD